MKEQHLSACSSRFDDQCISYSLESSGLIKMCVSRLQDATVLVLIATKKVCQAQLNISFGHTCVCAWHLAGLCKRFALFFSPPTFCVIHLNAVQIDAANSSALRVLWALPCPDLWLTGAFRFCGLSHKFSVLPSTSCISDIWWIIH